MSERILLPSLRMCCGEGQGKEERKGTTKQHEAEDKITRKIPAVLSHSRCFV
jgi:hypothetical protein